jgi:hypothetical protein
MEKPCIWSKLTVAYLAPCGYGRQCKTPPGSRCTRSPGDLARLTRRRTRCTS